MHRIIKIQPGETSSTRLTCRRRSRKIHPSLAHRASILFPMIDLESFLLITIAPNKRVLAPSHWIYVRANRDKETTPIATSEQVFAPPPTASCLQRCIEARIMRKKWNEPTEITFHVITLFCGPHFFHPPLFFLQRAFRVNRASLFSSRFTRLIRSFLSLQFFGARGNYPFLIIDIFHRDM